MAGLMAPNGAGPRAATESSAEYQGIPKVRCRDKGHGVQGERQLPAHAEAVVLVSADSSGACREWQYKAVCLQNVVRCCKRSLSCPIISSFSNYTENAPKSGGTGMAPLPALQHNITPSLLCLFICH